MEKIARSFEVGLQQSGITTLCINVADVDPDSLNGYDLIAVGAPTEITTAPKPIKEFLSRLEGRDFRRKYGFAFDIKLDIPMTGSAANYIEKKLKDLGLVILSEKASALVVPLKKNEIQLKEWVHEEYFPFKGEEQKRFEEIGEQLGAAFLKKMDEKRLIHAQ